MVMQHAELHRAGLKTTAPRLKILKLLEQTRRRHLRAEDIYQMLTKAGEEVGLATVYRVLTQFEEAGIVTRHQFDSDHAIFELNQGKHHDHAICIRCHRVEEFVDDMIEKHQKIIASQLGFKMTDHRLNIYGICRSCQK